MKNLFLYIFILSGLNSYSQDKIGEIDEGPVLVSTDPKYERIDAYQLVEVMPEFPGGNDSLKKFIVKNIKYPPYALENDIQGKCFVNFIVMPNGSIQDVKLIKGIGGGCNEEAIRLVKSMPKWKPGAKW